MDMANDLNDIRKLKKLYYYFLLYKVQPNHQRSPRTLDMYLVHLHRKHVDLADDLNGMRKLKTVPFILSINITDKGAQSSYIHTITNCHTGRVPCASASHVSNKICSTNVVSVERATDILGLEEL